MKRIKFILIIFILCSLGAKGQLVRIQGRPLNFQPDTTSVYSAKYAWNLSRIANMMKWIERNRLGCTDSVFVNQIDAKYRELTIYNASRLNYSLMDKQINQLGITLDKMWDEYQQRNSPEGLIKKEILSGNPDMTDNLVLDGIQLRDSDKQDNAYLNFKKAVEKEPSRLSYYYFLIMGELNFKRDTTKALEYLEKVICLSKGKKISVFEPYLQRAMLYTNRKQYNPAIDDCNQALEKEPNNLQVLYYRAFIKHEMKDYEGSNVDYNQVLTNLCDRPFPCAADSALMLNNIGWNYYLLKEYQLCVEYADKSLMLNPDAPYTLDTRGSGYFGLGKYEKCINDMTRVIGFEPELANSWYLRGLSWLKLDRKEKACADLTQAAALDIVEATDAKKGLCPPTINTEIEEQRKFQKSKPTVKNRFGINPYTMFFRIN